jgi:hypothetical protein
MAALLAPFHGISQWCVPTTLIPYDPAMPGITRVQINTIDRTSAGMEHYPNNNYTNTGLSTTLVKGTTYPITINFTIDPLICPDMNLRVWIDLNQDGQLDDIGETLLSADHRLPTSYSGTIVIPTTAMTGTTRMRITAKMSALGGHSLPTPCDIPADPIGYHGEMEDYTVNITASNGIGESTLSIVAMELQPNPAIDATTLSYTLAGSMPVRIDVIDATGREVMNVLNDERQAAGEHHVPINADSATLRSGIYFVRTLAGATTIVRRLAVDKR